MIKSKMTFLAGFFFFIKDNSKKLQNIAHYSLKAPTENFCDIWKNSQ